MENATKPSPQRLQERLDAMTPTHTWLVDVKVNIPPECKVATPIVPFSLCTTPVEDTLVATPLSPPPPPPIVHTPKAARNSTRYDGHRHRTYGGARLYHHVDRVIVSPHTQPPRRRRTPSSQGNESAAVTPRRYRDSPRNDDDAETAGECDSSPEQRGPPRYTRSFKSRPRCRYFGTQRGCRNGASCAYRHQY